MITDEARLTEDTKNKIRALILESAGRCVNIPYQIAKTDEEKAKLVGKWSNLDILPITLDCSGLTHGSYAISGLKLPHGSQNQYNYTLLTESPKPGDLAFLGREKGNPTLIYHVGILFDDKNIIEARDFDPKASFATGKVILRPREKWENYANFAGYRIHPKLV